jgi:hypothetical protein
MISDRYENLIAEGADLALRIGEQADSSFVTRKLGSARRLFVASPSYLARRQAPTRLADLADHDLIAGPSNPGGAAGSRVEGPRPRPNPSIPASEPARGPGSSPVRLPVSASQFRRSGCAGRTRLRRAGRDFGRVSPRSNRRVRRVPRRPPPLAKGARLQRLSRASERKRGGRESAAKRRRGTTVEQPSNNWSR